MAKEKYLVRGNQLGSILRIALAEDSSYKALGGSINRGDEREILTNLYSFFGSTITTGDVIGENLLEVTIEHEGYIDVRRIICGLEQFLPKNVKFERVV